MKFISMAAGFILASLITLGASAEPAGTTTRTMAGLDPATHPSVTLGMN